VIGVDMTDEQLEVARTYIDYHTKAFGFEKPNVEFRKGVIEDLRASAGIEDASLDCVISNCVINLVADKEKVFREVWRILRPGGEFYFSDVYSDRRIPEDLRRDKVLWGECLSGALYVEDFRRMMARAGFNYYYTVSQSEITVDNKEVERQLGEIKFWAITVRAYKIPELEDRCEDYGELATYKGTLAPGLEKSFKFDRSHVFTTGEKLRVCRNFSLVLSKCPLFSRHFEITPGKGHVGLFETSPGVCGC
jgi:arsenite methyltransferase